MSRFFFVIASFFGFLAVAGGAFGAHELRQTLSPEMLAIFETAVRYQMYHTFALALAAWASGKYEDRRFLVAGWLFVTGVALFSGSLYILAVSGTRWWGAVTPVGGVAFLAGWIYLMWGFWRVR